MVFKVSNGCIALALISGCDDENERLGLRARLQELVDQARPNREAQATITRSVELLVDFTDAQPIGTCYKNIEAIIRRVNVFSGRHPAGDSETMACSRSMFPATCAIPRLA